MLSPLCSEATWYYLAMADEKNLSIQAHFVTGKKDPAQNIQWKYLHCQIKDPQGNVYFELKNVQAPDFWSQLAVDIAAAKYFRKRGVPKGGKSSASKSVLGGETSVLQLIERVTEALQKTSRLQKYFSPSESKIFERELKYLLLNQMGSFNSPVWFNCGLFEKYGLSTYRKPQVSACFIQSIDDNLDSIFELLKTEARLFKYGSGSGTNFSNLRSKYEELEGGGTSSGLISFLEVFDRGAGSIKSGGTTRRAAKMVVVDIDHPEIEEFIRWKMKEEQKAAALIAAGYGPGIDGEAYRTVSGQNSNNSIRMTDKFMKAVLEDRDWHLKDRLHGKALRTLKAKDLWRSIAQSAWACADPGLQFHDAINKMNPVKKSGEIRASNPCSEYMFLDNSACNLASLNLIRFWSTEEKTFSWTAFDHAARTLYLSQDLFVDYAGYPTEEIAHNSRAFRPLGLGYAGLGALLMRMGIPYDSELARHWAAALTSRLTAVAYLTSTEIAAAKGPFPAFAKNKGSMLEVLKKHLAANKKIRWELLDSSLLDSSREDTSLKKSTLSLWNQIMDAAKRSGIRNAQATLIAPTGTIGLVMDSDTTGIEPDYSLVKIKKLAGGGEVQIVSTSLAVGLKALNYSASQIEKISDHVVKFGSILHAPEILEDHKNIFRTAQEISPEAHLLMMAVVQPFLSGAISKTINMPKSTTPEQVEDIHLRAWRLGLKSVAIYRDGSKQFQPLQTNPKCSDCGGVTEMVGSCWRCAHCGFVMGCA